MTPMPRRPDHVPTDEQRAQVEKLAAYGLTHAQIADVIGLGKTALRKHYRPQLRVGDSKGVAAILGSAHQQALGHPAEFDEDGNCIRPYAPPNPTMTIFLAKTRGKLREPPRQVEMGGIKDGQPVETKATVHVEIDADDTKV